MVDSFANKTGRQEREMSKWFILKSVAAQIRVFNDEFPIPITDFSCKKTDIIV